MLREKHGGRVSSSLQVDKYEEVASVEETTGLFLSVLGCWKANYEKIPDLECLGSLPAVFPSKGRWDADWSTYTSMRLLNLGHTVRWRSSVPSH